MFLKDKLAGIDLGTRGEVSATKVLQLSALEVKLAQTEEEEEKAAAKEEADAIVAVDEDDDPRGLLANREKKRMLDFMPRPADYETVHPNGQKFKELPIITLNAGKNNTKFAMSDAREVAKAYTSAGCQGFKGAKRGTNIAAQISAMNFAKKLVRQNKVTHVRVVVRGIGPGRLSALEGFVMGGLNVVSITDNTPVFALDPGQGPGPRPRKARRV